MPDITPESPVTDLWADRDGGLNGGRARARLAAGKVHTVADLLAKTGEDIRAIPRARDSVVAEVRLALTLAGLSLAGEPRPSPYAVEEAKRTARAQPQARRRKREPEPAPPVSAADFAALVADLRAELADADKERGRRLLAIPRLETPRAFAGRPWAWTVVGPSNAAKVTGYSAASIRAYKARSARERAEGTADERSMPQPQDGKWAVGDLAVWVATRNEGQAQPIILTDEQAAEIRAEIEAARIPGRTTRTLPAGLRAALAERYGVSVATIEKLASGTVPAEGRRGTLEARRQRRETEIIPAVKAAAAALREQDGQVTYLGLARVMGTGYRTAVGRAALAGVKSDLEREQADDAHVSAFLRGELARTRRFIKAADLLGAAHDAGLPASMAQLSRLLPDARAAEARRRHKPSSTERARGESLRDDGLLYTAEVAEDWAVTSDAITKAAGRGELVAKRDPETGRRLYDPARLRARKDRRRTPVDKGHPLAVQDEEG